MLEYPEKAKKAEKILEDSILRESNHEKREKLSSLFKNILLCKNAIFELNSIRHLDVLLPRELAKLEKELNIKL